MNFMAGFILGGIMMLIALVIIGWSLAGNMGSAEFGHEDETGYRNLDKYPEGKTPPDGI